MGSEHTFLTLLHRLYAILEFYQIPAAHRCGTCDVHLDRGARQCGLAGSGSLHVQPGREGAVAGAGENYDTDIGVMGELVKDDAQLQPHGPQEGVELGGPVDLHMGYIWGRRGYEEVRVEIIAGKGGRCCHSCYLFSLSVSVSFGGGGRCFQGIGSAYSVPSRPRYCKDQGELRISVRNGGRPGWCVS